MTSLRGGAATAPMPGPGWQLTIVEDVPVGWYVIVHGHMYQVTKTAHRDIGGGNGMTTLYGGPWGPDYIAKGRQVYMYVGEEVQGGGNDA